MDGCIYIYNIYLGTCHWFPSALIAATSKRLVHKSKQLMSNTKLKDVKSTKKEMQFEMAVVLNSENYT